MEFDLSVIIPNYNNERYIRQCINSVLEQSFQVKEIIVFDDCSTDSSHQILREFDEKYSFIHVIYSKQNVGVSAARNYAIEQAIGNYVTMLDSDDYYYDQNKLMREMKMVEEHWKKMGELACCFSQTVEVNEKGTVLSDISIKKLDKLVRFGTVTRMLHKYVPRDYCFPKSAYVSVGGYDNECNIFEDWDFNLKLLGKCDFVFSHGLGTAYRKKNGGLSDVSSKIQLMAKRNIFESNQDRLNYSLLERLTFYCLIYFSYWTKRVHIRR